MIECVQCQAKLIDEPLYWIQKSLPMQIDGIWTIVFKVGIDLALCGSECSLAYHIKAIKRKE